MVQLTHFFVKLKKEFVTDKICCLHFVINEIRATKSETRCLKCTISILLSADLGSMSLGYLISISRLNAFRNYRNQLKFNKNISLELYKLLIKFLHLQTAVKRPP